MSTTKTFNNIKSGKRHQIDATARGYYDFRTTVVPQPNKPLSYDMKVYDGLKYDVDLSKNSVRPGEINFDGTVLPYIENNTLTKTNYCFGNSGTNYDLPVYNKEYVNINKIGDFDIGDGIVSNFYRDHYLTVTLPNYSSGSVNSFEVLMKVHTPTNNTNNARILNSTDSYDNLALDLGTIPGFNFCGDTIGFGSQFDADIDLWVKVQFDGTNLSLHHSLNGVDYIQDNSKSWSKSNVWFTSNTYSLGLRSYDFVNACFFNGTIDLNECYVKINDEIINFGENTLQKQYTGYTLEGNASINGSICSGFDSNSRLYVENWNLDISKDNIFIFTTGNSVTENQVLLMVDETNDALQFFIGNSKLEYNSGSISEYTTENLEPNTLYKVKIHRQDEHTYIFSLSKNDGAFSDEKTITSNLFSDTYTNRITVGNYRSHSSPFQGTIDLSEMYNLLSIVTESKTGIFYNYEDTGLAVELNCFSKSNEFVVLSPDENITDHTWLGKVSIPEHKISWNEPSTPDTSTTDPATLKFGDRIDNKATVVGTFESSDLGTVAFAVLDSTYYGLNNWASGLNVTDTGLPNYATEDEVLVVKESATYNTDYILNNYSNKATEAFTYCRSIEPLNFNGKKYNCQLPNAYELKQIYNNSEKLYELDPTTSTNTSYNLANWDFDGMNDIWSSNECNSGSSWELQPVGAWYNYDKDRPLGIIPIIEIPLLK